MAKNRSPLTRLLAASLFAVANGLIAPDESAADAWPADDGVLVAPTVGSAWLFHAAGGDLQVITQPVACRTDATHLYPFGLARSVVTLEGVVTSRDSIVYCDQGPATDTYFVVARGLESDGLGHLFASEFIGTNFVRGSRVTGIGSFPRVDTGTASDYNPSQMTSSGEGTVYVLYEDDSLYYGNTHLYLRGFRTTGVAWQIGPLEEGYAESWNLLGTDATGDAIVGWSEYTSYGQPSVGKIQIYDHNGLTVWRASRLPIAGFRPHSAFSDGEGGITVVGWTQTGQSSHLLLIRFDADGNIRPGWPQEVAADSTTTRYVQKEHSLPDGFGGIYIIDGSSTRTLRRVLASGQPAPGWGKYGVPIQGYGPDGIDLLPDGTGGTWVIYWAVSGDITNTYCDHRLANGETDPDRSVFLLSRAPLDQSPRGGRMTGVLPDGTGGLFAAWADTRNQTRQAYVRHVSAGALSLARPVLVRADTSLAGVDLEWAVGSPAFSGHVSRRGPDAESAVVGNVTADGSSRVHFRDATADYATEYCYRLTAATDTSLASAEYCATTTLAPLSRSLLVKHVARTNEIELDWDVRIPDFVGKVVRRSFDGAWTHVGSTTADSTGTARFIDRHVRHEREYCYRLVEQADPRNISRPVCVTSPPASIALSSAHMGTTAVDVDWNAGSESFTGTVLRAIYPNAWQKVAQLDADSSGHVKYHDPNPVAYRRYCYRLLDADNPHTSSEDTCVTTGAVKGAHQPIAFSVSPSPTPGRLRISYEAESIAPIDVELFDVQGRAVASERLTPASIGAQSFVLAIPAWVRSGIYIVQVRENLHVHRTRIALVR